MPSSDMDADRPRSREEVLTPITDDFIIGDRVWVNGTKPGYIQYLGETQFSPGDWAGVVLDDHSGKNDGSLAGVRYFQCEPKRGVFARLHRLTRYPNLHAMPPSKVSNTPTPPPIQRCLTPTRTPSPGARNIREGDRVHVASSAGPPKCGLLRYLGHTDFAAGEWAGIELDEPLGKNDGTVAGKRYFRCAQNYGLFSPAHKVSRVIGSIDRHFRSSTPHGLVLEREDLVKNSTTEKDEPVKRFAEESEKRALRLRQLLEAAETERRGLAAKLDEERKKVEELEFRIEEECIGKDDLEMERDKERRKIEELERKLEQESRKNEMVARGVTPDSILKEETKRLNEELDSLREKLRQAEQQIKDIETAKQKSSTTNTSSYSRADELTRKEEALLQAQLTLDNKKREVQNLLDRISEMEKELEKSKARQSRQLDAIDELNRKLQKSESKCASLEEELHTTKEKIEEMERRLNSTNDRVAQLEKEKKRLEDQLLKPESTPEEQALRERLEDRERDVTEWRKEAESARSEVDKLREDRDKTKRELEDKIRKMNEDYQEERRREKKKNMELAETSSKKIKELERTLAKVRADLDQSRTESETRLSRQEARIQEAELKSQNVDRQREQISRIQKEKDLLRTEKEELSRRLKASEESRTKWESEATRSSAEVNTLKNQVQHLRTEFTTHREDLVKKLAETKFDAEAVQNLHEQIEEQRRLVETFQERLRYTESERDELQNNLSSAQNDQAQVETTLRHEVDTLKKRLSESESERKSIQRSLEASQLLVEEEQASQQHQQSQRMEKIDLERERLEQKVADLQKELATAKTGGQVDPESEYEKLRTEKEALEQQVHFMHSVIVDMQHKNDDLRSRMDILETEVMFDSHFNMASNFSHRGVTTRLFCDICDIFDIHDTEDCPRQLTSTLHRMLSISSQESEF